MDIIKDYSLKPIDRGHYAIQCFTHRFQNLPELFAQALKAYDQRTLLIEGDKRLTFGETEEQMQALAAGLTEGWGLQKGDHAGLLMENSIHFILAFLAIAHLGATAVVFNHHLTPSELSRQMEKADLSLLMYSPSLSSKVESLPPDTIPESPICLDDQWIKGLEIYKRAGSPEIDEEDTALILFTSGTTGLPKGTMISHRNLITSACKQGFAFSQYLGMEKEKESKTILVAPLFHVLAIQELLLGAIFNGTTLCLLPTFKADQVLDLIVREQVTMLSGTPTMYWLLIHKTPIQKEEVRSVKAIKYGGAPMAPDLLTELKALFEKARFLNGYGMTEASVITLLRDEDIQARPLSVGRPALGSEIKFVDTAGEAVQASRIGELAVRGGLVSKGYYKEEEETRRAYRDGWFFSGDLGYQDDEGFVFLVGRSKEMISRGGEKVYPVEVENVLHLHPKILDGSVFGVPDKVMGEAVACCLVLRPGENDFEPSELKDFCRDKLAYYKIPQQIFVVPELPRNPGGKVLKKELIERFGNI